MLDTWINGVMYELVPLVLWGEIQNVMRFDEANFRRNVRNVAAQLQCGGYVARQGQGPFYDITAYAPNKLQFDAFVSRLVGNVEDDAKDANKDANKDAIKHIAQKGECFAINGGKNLVEFTDAQLVSFLAKMRIIPSNQTRDDGKTSGEDTDTSTYLTHKQKELLSLMYT